MERMTVEKRDGVFMGVVQSLRGDSWKTVLTLPETASEAQGAAITATREQAALCACVFVLAAPALVSVAA